MNRQYNTSEVLNFLNLTIKINNILREELNDSDWEILKEIATENDDLFQRLVEIAFEMK